MKRNSLTYRVDRDLELDLNVVSREDSAEKVNETKKTKLPTGGHQRRANSNIYQGFINANDRKVNLVSANPHKGSQYSPFVTVTLESITDASKHSNSIAIRDANSAKGDIQPGILKNSSINHFGKSNATIDDNMMRESQLTRTEIIPNVTSQLICTRQDLTSKQLAEKLSLANCLQKIDLSCNMIKTIPTLELIHH